MRFLIKPIAIACLAVGVVSGVGAAMAQQGGGSVSGPVEVKGGADVSLSPQQMLDRARLAIPAMERSGGFVAERLVDAKKKRDVVKALCLDDKVKQIRLATATSKDRVLDLGAAVSQGDPDRSRHEFTVINVLRERVQTLVSEAQQCIGEETGFVGNSDVTVEVDPALPNADPSQFPNDELISDPPVLSSPML
jgi:hypothetical protein